MSETVVITGASAGVGRATAQAFARRREVFVGGSTWRAILANKLVPGYLDRYLARFGYRGQLSSLPAEADRPDNLFTPVAGDFGAHGRFDARACRHSLMLWLAEHADRIATVGLALGAMMLALAVAPGQARRAPRLPRA